MMNPPSKFEWVIGLYSNSESAPPAKVFVRFYATVTSILTRLDVAMTHLAAEGEGHSGKLVTVGSAAAKRVVGSRFAGITVLSCVVSPEGSKEPGYDRVVSANLCWNAPNELLLCLVVNDELGTFLSSAFEATLLELLDIECWSFGYAFRDTVERQPDFHVLGLDNGGLTQLESQALRKWYVSKSSERNQRLRSVYPITILNERQLELKVNGETMAEFVQRSSETTSKRVGNLVIWHVPEEHLQRVRNFLGSAGALIAW